MKKDDLQKLFSLLPVPEGERQDKAIQFVELVATALNNDLESIVNALGRIASSLELIADRLDDSDGL